MNILVINAGSSSLKYQLIDMESKVVLAKGLVERIGLSGSRLKHQPHDKDNTIIESPIRNHAEAIKVVVSALVSETWGVIRSMKEIGAVGHRVVHGGENFSGSVMIDDKVLKTIEDCIELAPLHNPPNLIGIRACTEIMPKIKQVAVFDTAFHQTMPKKAYMYALPSAMYERYKIRKYGFHGTSHHYVALRAAEMLGRPLEELKIVTCHLGNGSSLCAIDGGKSVDTSMGFTPLAGVIMGTRCGTIDPAIVPFIMEKERMDTKEISEYLNRQAGMLGITGISSDFRDIDNAADHDDPRAKLGLSMFSYSIRSYIGQYAAIMGGVDAVVFTAGIGENNGRIRQDVVKGLSFLGIKVDSAKNEAKGIEIDISTDDATVRTLVIPTNEELMIAMETEKLVKE